MGVRQEIKEKSMTIAIDRYIAQALEKGETKLARRLRNEKRMASALVRACLTRGYTVSLHNGEDWEISHSRNYRELMAALFSTDEETVVIRETDGRKVGWFFLVYGNSGYDVVSDYADNEACNEIWHGVILPLADRMEEGR
jgi:hypothetical protein